MLNHIVIMGRLTRDPELRRTGSGTAVAGFTVAVERDAAAQGKEKETDFIDCVAWGPRGEFVSKYFSKGSMIVVSGRLQMRKWTDKDGNKRVSAEINASDIYFGESKGRSEGRPAAQGGGDVGGGEYYSPAYAAIRGGTYAPSAGGGSNFAMLEDDDANLPF